ncbi:Di-and tricarboxylate transporter [Myxococcus fulvus]|uniref:Di-and tricarboxylate transporter n=1 Tax=Myxococcus fulvus TaxID=33 RepID=A0A511STE7_MYXFU|nr:SLC13 family permease [Myxococcus fulvus]AKF79920.1 potassium transporter TrkA [Myxococcus fulvus 124B02]GEN05199.1 SLC13 family permease [Myxococcus fulvus]SET15146.1 Di-and tricarboxylate transporter [Myxococcus fulvus]
MTIAIVLAVVLIALVLFTIDSIPIEVSSLVVVCLLALTGVLTPRQAFEGFSNDTVIFIFTLLAMTQGLASTGVVQLVGQRLAFFARFGHQTFVMAMMVVVAAFSSVISNTVTTAAFLPVAIGAANRAKVPKSKVLLPLAYASMLGGMVFLYGTSTNLVMSAALERMGMRPIGVAELAPVGLPLAVIGILVVVVLGPLLLPSRVGKGSSEEWTLRDYLTEAVLPAGSRYLGKPLAEITEGLGLRVIGLLRDGKATSASPSQVLFGDERLLVEGSREDILRVKDLRGIEIRPDLRHADEAQLDEDTALVEAAVPPGSPLVGRSLKEAFFVERYGLVALALHRHPSLQRVTKLQLLGRIFGERRMSLLPLAVGDVLLLRGPKQKASELSDGASLTVLSGHEYQPPRYGKALLAVVLFLCALAAGSLDILPLSVAGLTGMLAMIATGCVDARKAFRVDWRVVLLIGSMMALGLAMEVSGAGKFLGQRVAELGDFGGPRTVLVALMLLTIVLSAPMSNQAAALVVLPVAVNAATQLGVDVRPFAIGVTLAASCSFITPLEPSCVLVYGPGHYRFTDFFRLGTPLTLLLVVVLTLAVPWVWPF